MGDWYEIPDPPYFRYDPDAPSPGRNPALTQILPVVGPESGAGENDDLVERTDNGLRPDDLDLEQPPQSPAWEPE